MWFVPVTFAAAPPRPLPVVVREEATLLALGSIPAELPRAGSPDGAGWTEPVADEAVEGVRLGDPWVVLGADGSRAACRVTGFRRSAVDAQGYGSEDDPTCGGWSAWAELSCDRPAADGVALPGRRTVAKVFAERDPVPAERAAATKALADSPEWKATLAAVGADGDLVQERADVRSYGPWTVVEASAYTGDGYVGCGAEARLERRVLVLGADGLPLGPARTLAGPWSVDDRIVDAVYDLNRDGAPELRVSRVLEETVLVGPDGAEAASLPEHFCGCPC